MLDCPHCSKPAMTQAQKAWLGPAKSIACASCGQQVSVSWLAMLGMLPFLLAIPAAALLLRVGWYYSVAVLLIGLAAMFFIHARLVPLSRR